MRYHVTSVIHLSLEKWYNKGMTPERAKEIIEGIDDFCPGLGGIRLYCEPQGINMNWNVCTQTTNADQIWLLVATIEDAMNRELGLPCTRHGGVRA